MKKIAAIIIMAGMLMSLFGCQPTQSDSSSATSNNPSAVVSESAASDEKSEQPESTVASTKENSVEESSAVGESSAETSEEKSQDESSADTSGAFQMGECEYTESNGIVVVKDRGHYRAVSLLGGGTGNAYVSALNAFHQDLGDSVKIYSATAPLPSEFYIPSNYDGYVLNQKEEFDDVASRLDDGIVYVDIDTALSKHAAEDIYLRTDHHWAPLGAYYAAEAIASAAGVPFKELSTYTANDIDGYMGTMSYFTGDENLSNDPELFRYYVPENNDNCKTEYFSTSMASTGSGNFFNDVGDPQSNAYLTFMGGDEQIVKITTDVENGRKLMIIKDSYGNAMPEYFFGSFEEIYVVDMRYCDVNVVNLIKVNGITDVAFVMVAYSLFGDNADNLDVIRTQ